MKIKKTVALSFVITMFIISACEKTSLDSIYMANGATIYYSDNEGNDLLNETGFDKSINRDEIKISHLIDEEEVDINLIEDGVILDNPNPFSFDYRDDISKNVMNVHCIIPKGQVDFESEILVTELIRLSENDTDTIVFEVKRNSMGAQTTKIWYNGILKFENIDNGHEAIFEVIK